LPISCASRFLALSRQEELSWQEIRIDPATLKDCRKSY
jgi:hypothetical protein